MRKDARERGIKIRDGELAMLVLADILENVAYEISEAVKSLDQLS
jgi:hypothetical protein